MKLALSWTLFAALAVHLGAHVAIAIGFARRRAWSRATVAFFVPPLALFWGYREGMKRRAYAWAMALTAYALAVAIAGR